MPHKPRHPCNKRGCRKLTTMRFCQEHEKEYAALYEQKRGSSSGRGYDAEWHRISRLHLREFPLCARCGQAATLTHHIIRIADGGSVKEYTNLESLCNDCHDKIHAEHRYMRRRN